MGVSTAAGKSPSLRLGAILVSLLLGCAALSLVWTPHSATDIDVAMRLAQPSASHWLGTDSLGRDIASQLMAGAQGAVLVGVLAVGFGSVLGIALGALAAASKGLLEEALMRASDLGFAFPALITALMLAAIFGPGLATSIAAIAIFNVPVFARITRASASSIWARDYVLAARVAGKGKTRITTDHVLPNIAGVLIVQATVSCATAILAEAALSYLGLGAQPPSASWGRMLGEAQAMLFQAPQLSLWPGLAIALSVLGLNLLGDGLRDVMAARVRGG